VAAKTEVPGIHLNSQKTPPRATHLDSLIPADGAGNGDWACVLYQLTAYERVFLSLIKNMDI